MHNAEDDTRKEKPGTKDRKLTIRNARQALTCSTSRRGVDLQLRTLPDKVIAGRLIVKLMFCVDERNNMNAFALDDRLTYEVNHERDPVVLFRRGELEIAHKGNGSLQSINIAQELDGFRAAVTLAAREDDPYFTCDLRITNVSDDTVRLMVVRLGLEEVRSKGRLAQKWTSPPESYKAKCFTRGLIEDLPDTDLRLAMPPCGLIQPVIFVGDVMADGCALEFSPWLANYGSIILSNKADLAYSIFVDRYIEPNEEHHVGTLLLRILTEGWQRGLSRFTEAVPARFGFRTSPNIPDWVHELRLVTFPPRIAPIGNELWRDYFEWAKNIGFNGVMGFGWIWKRHNDRLCAISPEDGTLRLDAEHGATEEAVKRHNKMLHGLGMKSIVWTPTTGASAYAKICEQHPEWFIRDDEGRLRSSWHDRNGKPWLVDSNPFSEGYHRYWRDLIFQIAEWGFDGVFLDGVIARPSDAWSRPFPGRVHNGMYEAIRRLRKELNEAGLQNFIIKPEAGDVMLIPSSYLMNMPRLRLAQPLPPSRNMPEEILNTPRYFNYPDCPCLDESWFTEHLELTFRSWPRGMPGNWSISTRSFETPSLKDLARIGLSYLIGSVVSIHLMLAQKDPDFKHFKGAPNEEIPQEESILRRMLFRHLRRLNRIRKENPMLARAPVDFDSFHSNDGAVPAFVRSLGGEIILVVANMSGRPKQVTVTLSESSEKLSLPRGNSLKARELISNRIRNLNKAQLLAGMNLEFEPWELVAWKVLK